jgi:predicted DNA-binding transcriptional regulator AlpA
MSRSQHPIPATGFLRLNQVLAIIPIGKSTWWRGCKSGIYPAPVKLAPRTTAWRAEDIAALVERLGNEGKTTSGGKK